MPGVSGVTVVTNARAFYTTRAAAGASGARHSLRPLFFRGWMFVHNSGGSSRENVDACADYLSAVIAREGGRSGIPEASVMEPISRGVLDTPSSRGMTV